MSGWKSKNGWGAGGASSLQRLKKTGLVLLLDANKANGTSKGVNNPLTRSLTDLSRKLGKNLFDFSGPFGTSTTAVRQLYRNGFKVSANGTNELMQVIMYYALKPNTQYTLRAIINNLTSPSRRISVRNSSSSGIGDLYATGSTTFITDATGSGSIYFQASTVTYTGPSSVEYLDIQIEEGAVATSYEPYALNNACLSKFAGTASSGYVEKVLANGRTKTFVKTDKVDDILLLKNSEDIDILGTENFAIGALFITPSTISAGYLLCKGLSSASAQYTLLLQADGSISANIAEVTTHGLFLAGTLVPNTRYVVVIERIDGRLKSYKNLDPIPLKDVASVEPLTSMPNFTIFGRSASVEGTSFATLAETNLGVLAIARGSKGDVAQFRKELINYCKDYF